MLKDLIRKLKSSQIEAADGLNTLVTRYEEDHIESRFRVYDGDGASNVTGDGTEYVIIPTVEDFDKGNDFDLGTGVFTAPKAGVYMFGGHINITLDSSVTICQFGIKVGTLEHWLALSGGWAERETDNDTFFTLQGNTLVELAADDTVSFILVVTGTTKTIEIIATDSSAVWNAFWGYWVGP